MQARFDHLVYENAAHTIASFYFVPNGTYRYEAGQYAVFTVPHDEADSRGTSRTMTLSSSPTEPLLKFTCKLYGDTGSTYKKALLALKPGSEVTIYESMGDLVLPLDASIPLVFVAGGVGIASYTGIVQWLVDNHDKRNIQLFYTTKSKSEIVLQQPFDVYATGVASLTKRIYTPDVNIRTDINTPATTYTAKRLDAADVLASITPETLLYLSGPETMVEQLRTDLASAGVSRSQIVFDYFDGYSEL